jgi:hypothetical protein
MTHHESVTFHHASILTVLYLSAGELPPSGHCLLPSSSPPPPLLPVRHHTAATLNNIPRSSLVWCHTTAPGGSTVKDLQFEEEAGRGTAARFAQYRSPPLVMNAPVGSCWPRSQHSSHQSLYRFIFSFKRLT